ncbi:hypothetical protein ACE1B6_22315 [Aerosakkonemataceae cyanobacterium BLCC-F154]|uniref:Uncharacterized protein n=1 Tax=Floridaenema fluviatile BLCC-F154 TaxID=3153640 RepID=A0ABV4YGV4_9CYAN
MRISHIGGFADRLFDPRKFVSSNSFIDILLQVTRERSIKTLG